MFHNFILILYYQSPNLQEDEQGRRRNLKKPVPNAVWKEFKSSERK
jgi:hypothetical protein